MEDRVCGAPDGIMVLGVAVGVVGMAIGPGTVDTAGVVTGTATVNCSPHGLMAARATWKL